MLKLCEMFKSIDGEGRRAGMPTIFIRLYGCNLNCSYCDSRYACCNGEYELVSVDTIVQRLLVNYDHDIHNITVTGGEPLIQDDVWDLLKQLSERGYDVNVETNGSQIVKHRYRNVWFTVDYKCPSSNMEELMVLYNFHKLHSEDVIKFVVGTQKDLDTAIKYSMTFHEYTDAQIYWSPVFGTIKYEDIVNYLLTYNLDYVKFQVQLHKIIWDPDKRGV